MPVDGRTRTVAFWRAVEMLSPGTLPKAERRGGPQAEQQVFDLGPKDLTPWSEGHPLTATPLHEKYTWQFTVYGGLYELAAIRRALADAFGDDSVEPEARKPGETALFAFTVDAAGFLVEDSGTLSSCAWALGRLGRTRRAFKTWLDGFEQEERAFSKGLDRLAPPSDEKPATVGKALREHVKGAALEAAGAGAKATGAAVTTATTAAVGSVAGTVIGGIAGTVAGTFAEKLLTPGKKPAGNKGPRTPPFELTAAALHGFVAELAEALGVADVLSPRGIRVKCARVPIRDAGEATDQALVNSFIAADLAKVEQALRTGDAGPGLLGFLTDSTGLPRTGRIDVREQPEAVADGVHPAVLPTGRWPGDPAKPLVLSQQFAVNRIMAELGGRSGVFAVNGPPGTGKTTLLRDVVAAIVVDRARTLSGLAAPADAFTGELGRVKITERWAPAVRGLQPVVTGAEILVATAGNIAAANVTAEIPGVGAVGGAEEAAKALDYFSELASHVLDAPAWGLLAAKLGNRANCGEFVKRFWWGDETRRGRSAVPGMQQILQRAREEPETVPDWNEAVKRFQAAEAEVARLVEERAQVAEALRQRPRLHDELRAIDQAVAQLQHARTILQHRIGEARRAHQTATAAAHHATEAHREHRADKPGFWVSLSTLFRAGREWDVRHRELAAHRDRAVNIVRHWEAELHRLDSEIATLESSQRVQNDRRGLVVSTLAAVTATITAAHERWPGRLPDVTAFSGDPDALQLCAPWADEEFSTARNRVTRAALHLHKAFVLGAGAPLRDNLTVVAAVLGGSPEITDKALLAAWQTLFLVVPVVSTTFASLPRLFGRLGPEALGWLFIDEAGQATPQQALGGVLRTRRSVIVGDPQQLEPIVTLPSTAQQALLKRYEVAEEWLPDATSAQRVADRLNTFGTFLPDPDGDTATWVGAPLRVHRRCDRTMFEIANRIAYGGTLMVYGTGERPAFPGTDQWIDVSAGLSDGHWIPAEGQELARLLAELAAQGVAPSDVRVISPFRDVVRGARRVALQAWGGKFAQANVGTVHTVQGQEADVVVLVLGGAPEREGARRWAARKPNLLNVAVSRAKRRLYVIGDRRRWRAQRHFDVLAAALPADPPR